MPQERWFAPPQPGDIVWCRFPVRRSEVGPKPRPALVLSVGELDGRPIVEVAYGTSRKINELFAGEFAILSADVAAYAASGLSYPTKFDLGSTFELDCNDVWFAVPTHAPHGQTPKLGILHPSLVRRAHAAYKASKR